MMMFNRLVLIIASLGLVILRDNSSIFVTGQQCTGRVDLAIGIALTYDEYVQAQSDLWDTIGDSDGPYREEIPANVEGLNIPNLFSCAVYCADEIGCGSVSIFEDITDNQLQFILDAPFRPVNPAPYGIAGGGDGTAVEGGGFSRDIEGGCLGDDYLLERLSRTEFNIFSIGENIDINRKLVLVEGIKTLKKGTVAGATSFDTADCFVQIQPSIDDQNVGSLIDEGLQEELNDFELYRNRITRPCAFGFFCFRNKFWCFKCKNTSGLSFEEWKNLDEKFQQEKLFRPRVLAATNRFPAGDRVCVWTDPGDGKRKAQVEHMSDTEINGLIGGIQEGVLGSLFTPQIVEAFANECRQLGSETLQR